MPTWRIALYLCAAVALLTQNARASVSNAPRRVAPPRGMALVGPGAYRPLYPAAAEERSISVERFFLDVHAVTNAEFLAFVQVRPEWRRDRIGRLFADEGYLSHWADAETLGASARGAEPVTRVSWFAARAYCAFRGGRLPSEREWELAALASETARDGSRDPAWRARILAWYSEPSHGTVLADADSGAPNYWGIRGLHGVVWEWVSDFNGSLVSDDSREKDGADRTRFCGGAGAESRDPSDYAAFMRVAFRTSLEARYTTSRLGFRCARTAEVSP